MFAIALHSTTAFIHLYSARAMLIPIKLWIFFAKQTITTVNRTTTVDRTPYTSMIRINIGSAPTRCHTPGK